MSDYPKLALGLACYWVFLAWHAVTTPNTDCRLYLWVLSWAGYWAYRPEDGNV